MRPRESVSLHCDCYKVAPRPPRIQPSQFGLTPNPVSTRSPRKRGPARQYPYLYRDINRCVCVCVCVCMYMFMYVYVCMYSYIYIFDFQRRCRHRSTAGPGESTRSPRRRVHAFCIYIYIYTYINMCKYIGLELGLTPRVNPVRGLRMTP